MQYGPLRPASTEGNVADWVWTTLEPLEHGPLRPAVTEGNAADWVWTTLVAALSITLLYLLRQVQRLEARRRLRNNDMLTHTRR